MRRLKGRPPVSDLFGVKGRQWLRGLELPVEEAETVEGCMRHVEFLDSEIAEVERLVARQMLSCSDARRLMSVPGVNADLRGDVPGGDRRGPRASKQPNLAPIEPPPGRNQRHKSRSAALRAAPAIDPHCPKSAEKLFPGA